MFPAEGKKINLWVKGQQQFYLWRLIILWGRKGKSKLHPITCHEGIKGNQMYNSFFSLALDGDEWSTPSCGRFTPKNDPVPTV
jgi:hypothetical protein